MVRGLQCASSSISLARFLDSFLSGHCLASDESALLETAAARPPTLLDRKILSQNIYNISPEDLGRLVQLLDQRCEACIKKIDAEDIEVRLKKASCAQLHALIMQEAVTHIFVVLQIDIDSIDNLSFWVVDSFVKDCLPGNKKGGSGALRKTINTAAAKVGAQAATSGSPVDGPSKPKKLRT
jgi:hypothetical protein